MTRTTRSILGSTILATLAAMACLGPGPASAGTDLNEVGAILVYPYVAAFHLEDDLHVGAEMTTLLTMTNAGATEVVAHVSFIDGQSMRRDPYGGTGLVANPDYCYECSFLVPLSGNDTETLVVKADSTDPADLSVEILSLDTGIAHSCPMGFGMVVVTLEDSNEQTLQSNVLLGEQIIVDEANAWAWSIPAIPFQGKNAGDADRAYRFDDQEYGKLPRVVATDFIAPDPVPGVTAELALFTLNFERQHPPRTDCSITGFDASEHPFSRSVLFGCWALFPLEAISSEFLFGNLGAYYCDDTAEVFEDGYCDEHGWLSANCRVDREANGTFEATGAVHGAIVQTATGRLVNRVDVPGGVDLQTNPMNGAWARLLYQSVTTGSAVTLTLEGPGGSMLGP